MKKLRVVLAYAFLAVLVGANVVAFMQRERIADWWAMRGYTPSAEVASLVSQTTMTPVAQHLFYVNRPSLEDKAGFNEHCSSKTEHSVVLGCYHGNRQGIYLYNVIDERLQGVKQVTAAHEMLHQAFDRLSEAERTDITSQMEQFAQSGGLEARVEDKLNLYRESDSSDLPNEMHSIFGTEVADLPEPLETYYKRYFKDRAAVVAFSATYQSEFEARKAKVAAYDAQLADLDRQIESNKRDLSTQSRSLGQMRRQVESLASSGDAEAYRAGVEDYNARVRAYNDLIDATQALVNTFNTIVVERNAISAEEQDLQKALDSRRQEATAP